MLGRREREHGYNRFEACSRWNEQCAKRCEQCSHWEEACSRSCEQCSQWCEHRYNTNERCSEPCACRKRSAFPLTNQGKTEGNCRAYRPGWTLSTSRWSSAWPRRSWSPGHSASPLDGWQRTPANRSWRVVAGNGFDWLPVRFKSSVPKIICPISSLSADTEWWGTAAHWCRHNWNTMKKPTLIIETSIATTVSGLAQALISSLRLSGCPGGDPHDFTTAAWVTSVSMNCWVVCWAVRSRLKIRKSWSAWPRATRRANRNLSPDWKQSSDWRKSRLRYGKDWI